MSYDRNEFDDPELSVVVKLGGWAVAPWACTPPASLPLVIRAVPGYPVLGGRESVGDLPPRCLGADEQVKSRPNAGIIVQQACRHGHGALVRVHDRYT